MNNTDAAKNKYEEEESAEEISKRMMQEQNDILTLAITSMILMNSTIT